MPQIGSCLENEKKVVVSVIMPAHNSEKFIGEAIKSVVEQTFEDWELIVINDGSSDNTEKIIKNYQRKDGRIKQLKFTDSKGAWKARSEGMRISKGRYIAFLDSDDIWVKDKLTKQIGLMEREGIDFSSTAYKMIDELGNDLGRIFVPPKLADYARVLLDCPVGNSTVVYNASKFGRGYGPNVAKREDYAFWLSLLKRINNVYGIQNVLVKYRVRKGSYSSHKLGLIPAHWKLYRKFEHLSRVKSALHIIWWCLIKVTGLK